MKNCHDIKAQIDHFTQISQQQRQDIYQHMSTCQECAEYKAVADSTADLLGSLNTTLKQMPVNQQIYQQVNERSKRERRLTFIAMLMMVTSVLALLWFYSQNSLTLVGGIILADWAVGSAMVAWWSARQATKFAGTSNGSSEGFLSRWAKDLRQQITFTKMIASIVSLEIGFVLFNLVRDGFAAEQSVVLLIVNAVLAIGVIYAFTIELPALKNELLLISEAS